MPELPEVETVMRGLTPALEGQRLTKVQLNRADLRFPFPDRFAERLMASKIRHLRRRAKYMLWELEEGGTALMHLGMSGRFTFADGPIEKHDHVVFTTEAGTQIRYNDPRRFGFMDFIEPGKQSRFLSDLGPEPLGNAFNGTYLHAQLQGRASSIKARLLDQRVVVGVGNIYCCEALFQAGICPMRPAAKITPPQAEKLARAIRQVLTRAIAAGGSSLRDYVQADGELGYFQHDWAVYGREGAACRTCGTPIKRIVQSNRSSFYCPTCQK